MKGKICMVTGANSGIGKAITQRLANMGATVVMVCRDFSKGEAARGEVQTLTGSQSVELMVADLSSLDSVRRLAQDYLQKHDHLHVLVNNAGVVEGNRVMTGNGLEETFVVNYLSHFLLTNLLLDVLKTSAPARIINVTSSFHRRGHIDFEDLQLQKSYSATKAYSQSKLAQVLFTYELSRRLEGTGVAANCVHPGAVRTRLGDEGGLTGVLIRIGRPFMHSPEEGAETPVYLATANELEGVTGKYFVNKGPEQSSKESYNEQEARQLWEISMKLSGLS